MAEIESKAKRAGQTIKKDDPRLKFEYKGPLNSILLGRHGWPVLHAFTLRYPDSPSDDDKKRMKDFIDAFSWTFPCSNCATDFRKEIDETPPNLHSRKMLSMWMCEQHNTVNKKLGKPEFK